MCVCVYVNLLTMCFLFVIYTVSDYRQWFLFETCHCMTVYVLLAIVHIWVFDSDGSNLFIFFGRSSVVAFLYLFVFWHTISLLLDLSIHWSLAVVWYVIQMQNNRISEAEGKAITIFHISKEQKFGMGSINCYSHPIEGITCVCMCVYLWFLQLLLVLSDNN